MTVAEGLKRFRKEFNVTQKQAAEAAEIIFQLYQKYEYGTHVPAVTVLMKIAEAFDVSLDYLVGRADNPRAHHERG